MLEIFLFGDNICGNCPIKDLNSPLLHSSTHSIHIKEYLPTVSYGFTK